MASIQILGKLGENAEVKTHNNSNYIEFSIAETVKKNNGEKETLWYKCTYWRNNTQILDWMKKGSEFFIVGELKSQGVGQTGKCYNNVLVHNIKFTGGSTSNNNQNSQQQQNNGYNQQQNNGYGQQQNNGYGQQQQNNQGYQQNNQRQQQQNQNNQPKPDLDDDLPF